MRSKNYNLSTNLKNLKSLVLLGEMGIFEKDKLINLFYNFIVLNQKIGDKVICIDKILNQTCDLYERIEESKQVNEIYLKNTLDEKLREAKAQGQFVDRDELFKLYVRWQKKLGFFAFAKHAKAIGLIRTISDESNPPQHAKRKVGRPKKQVSFIDQKILERVREEDDYLDYLSSSRKQEPYNEDYIENLIEENEEELKNKNDYNENWLTDEENFDSDQ